jgi:PAS domain S-box-containing protein
VALGGFLGGVWPAVAAALLGALALILWHPEMTDGRTLGELGAVALFVLMSAILGGLFQRLHQLRGAASEPLIPPPPERLGWRGWLGIVIGLAGSMALTFVFDDALHHRVPFLFIYPVVAIAGYLGGWRPAVAVGVVSAGLLYLWHPGLPPRELESAITCTIFLFSTVLMGWLAEQLHRARHAAAAGARALRELPEARARFVRLTEVSPDAIWVFDLTSERLNYISPGASKVFGYQAAELTDGPAGAALALIHPEDLPLYYKAMETLIAAPPGQVVEYELRMRRRDGSWRWMRNRASVYSRSTDETPLEVFGFTEDVTERKELVERLARQAEERAQWLEAERAARGEAERANRLKDEFLATVSHELRTPLTAMLGWAEMLAETATDPELCQGLQVINRNARAQRQLIEDLLDMSRILSGKMRLEVAPVLLGQVIGTAIETVAPAAEARGVSLISDVRSCEDPLPADADRLQQIVWNLLSNAVKFTPAGGQVCIRAETGDGEAQISVLDTGQRMTPEFVPHVFERFRQEDASSTRKAGGLGLGLAIVKHLVELHGGTISAHSEGLGKGSVFTVILPHHQRIPAMLGRSADPALDGAGRDHRPPRELLNGVRLLIIDDEADMRGYLHRLLTERGAIVGIAESAAEGLRRAREAKPDVVICDISMPGEDGYSFIRQLRAEGDAMLRATPAAALTAFARAEDRQRALEAGFDEHVSKPVEAVEIVALVRRLHPA